MHARSYIIPEIGRLTVGIDRTARLRLNDTCFRPEPMPFSGNFLLWRDFEAMLNDPEFIERFLAAMPGVIGSIKGRRDRQTYFSIQHSRPVGWASTEPLDHFQPTELEAFALNARCTGLRVISAERHLAPLTDIVTFSGDFMRIGDYWSLVLYSMYPGICIGPLKDDISRETGQAFFRFDHPGTLPDP